MTISFFINRNDIQELNHLVENRVLIKNGLDKGAIIIECFNSIERIKTNMDLRIVPLNYIQVSIDYDTYRLINEYLRFI